MNASEHDNRNVCKAPKGATYNTRNIRRDLPIVLYDGDCGFCNKWVDRWHKMSGETVQYIPYQSFEADEAGKLVDFPQISVGDCKRAVQFILPSGEHSRAARAVFDALSQSGKQKWWLWLYKHFPGFKLIAEAAYTFIAAHKCFFNSR